MLIGDLVKLKNDVTRDNRDKEFVENAIKEDWIWLITSMDNEDLDYVIQPLYLYDDDKMTQLGGELLVLYDEIEKVDVNREDLFKTLRNY